MFGLGLGYGLDNGFRLEGVASYRNIDMDTPNTFIGVQPLGTTGPSGSGSTRVTNLMFNVIKDFDFGGNVTPYFGLGVGGARVDTRVSSLYQNVTGIRRTASTTPTRRWPGTPSLASASSCLNS